MTFQISKFVLHQKYMFLCQICTLPLFLAYKLYLPIEPTVFSAFLNMGCEFPVGMFILRYVYFNEKLSNLFASAERGLELIL